MILAGKKRGVRETSCHDTLSKKNLTWYNLELNSGLRGERPASNRLSLGTILHKSRETVMYLMT
jgi:hypothetical protein